eukprot:1113055-Rhodomonas_salina.1
MAQACSMHTRSRLQEGKGGDRGGMVSTGGRRGEGAGADVDVRHHGVRRGGGDQLPRGLGLAPGGGCLDLHGA